MRDMLVNNPKAVVIDCENERLAQLTQRLQRRQAWNLRDRLMLNLDWWGAMACVLRVDWAAESLPRKAGNRDGRVRFHRDTVRELKPFGDDRLRRRLQIEILRSGCAKLPIRGGF